MVVFACDSCGESLKKNAVEKHLFRCRNATYSCMDCQVSFDKTSYTTHLKCVSENQRYGGQNYIVKENKGEVKQTAWVEQVTKAITNVSDPGLKSILLQVAKYDNIPRKMAKFLNFLNNSLRIHNKDLCESAWKAIESEAIKMREAAIAKSEAAKQKAKEEKEAKEKKAAEDEEGKKNDGVDDVKVTTNNDFKWKSTIKRKLKAADNNTMKIKKLKTAVIEEFVASTGGEVDGTFSIMFEQKLTSAGVVIDGKVARLKQ